MKRIICLIFVFVFFNNVNSQTNNWNKKVISIYEDLISNIANNFPAPPEIKITKTKNNPAYISKGVIYIDIRLVNLLCDTDEFESKMAYVLSHELAHHYLNHSWASNTGLSYSNPIGEFIEDNSNLFSKTQRKLDESQADLFGGFFSQISGYDALLYGKETLKSIYEEYSIPKNLKGYPSLDERLDIVDSNVKKSNDLASIFHFGNMALAVGKLGMARNCFKEILNNNFTSREIYNNLGLSFLLNAIENSDSTISKYSYPIFIEQNTRAEVFSTRSGNFTNDPKLDLSDAIKYFENSLRLDSNFEPAKINLLVSDLILKKLNNNLSNSYLKDLESTEVNNQSILNDLKVLYILFKGKVKKAKKLAIKGSVISSFNTNIDSKKKFKLVKVKIPKYDKIDFSDFVFGLEKPYESVTLSSIKIKKKNYSNFIVYDFNTKKDPIIIEIIDPDYLNLVNNLNIKFNNVKLISNSIFKESKENKAVFKYQENKLVSIIFYQK
jgi:tetratricopeptide (TPR) repeat protein